MYNVHVCMYVYTVRIYSVYIYLLAAKHNQVRILSNDQVYYTLLTEVGQLSISLIRCHYTLHSCFTTLLREREGERGRERAQNF